MKLLHHINSKSDLIRLTCVLVPFQSSAMCRSTSVCRPAVSSQPVSQTAIQDKIALNSNTYFMIRHKPHLKNLDAKNTLWHRSWICSKTKFRQVGMRDKIMTKTLRSKSNHAASERLQVTKTRYQSAGQTAKMGTNIIRCACKALLGIKKKKIKIAEEVHNQYGIVHFTAYERHVSPHWSPTFFGVCVCLFVCPPNPPVLDFVTESTNLPHQMERFPYLMDWPNIPIWRGARAQRAFGKRKAKLGEPLGQKHLSVTLKRQTQTELSEASWVERPLTSPRSQFDGQQQVAQPAHGIEDIKW